MIGVSSFLRSHSNSAASIAEQFLKIFFNFYVGIKIAVYLGPADYGNYVYGLTVAFIVGIASKFGLDAVAVQWFSNNKHTEAEIFSIFFYMKICIASILLACLFLFVLLASGFEFDNKNLCLIIICFGTIYQAVEVYDFYYQAKQKISVTLRARSLQLIVSGILKITCIELDLGLLSLAILTSLDFVFLGIFYLLLRESTVIPTLVPLAKINLQSVRDLLAAGFPLFVSSILVMIYARADQIIIEYFLGAEQLGFYSAGLRLAEFWYFLPAAVVNSVFPVIMRDRSVDEKAYENKLKALFFVFGYASLFFCLFVFIFSGFIIRNTFGDAYASSASLLSILCFGGIFVAIGSLSMRCVIFEGHNRLVLINCAIAAGTSVVANVLLIDRFGLQVSAVISVVTQALSGFFLLALHKKTRHLFFLIVASWSNLDAMKNIKR